MKRKLLAIPLFFLVLGLNFAPVVRADSTFGGGQSGGAGAGGSWGPAGCSVIGAEWGKQNIILGETVDITILGQGTCSGAPITAQTYIKGGIGQITIQNLALSFGSDNKARTTTLFKNSDLVGRNSPVQIFIGTNFDNSGKPTVSSAMALNVDTTKTYSAPITATKNTNNTNTTNVNTTTGSTATNTQNSNAAAPTVASGNAGVGKAPWFPLVPCGLNQQPAGIDSRVHDYTQTCNQCLLVKLGKNVIDMILYAIVPAVGTLLFMIAGFMILWGAREGKSSYVATGKNIMTDAAIGIAIIFSSWLITNFVLKSLATDQVSGSPWYEIQCRVGDLKDLTIPTVAGIGTGQDGAPVGGVGGSTGTGTSGGSTTGSGSTAQCMQSDLNLCQGSAPQGCANPKCGQYADMIKRQANGYASENVLKAFAEVESSCDVSAASGTSYGLMQLSPATAQIYSRGCNVQGVIDQAWLTNPSNVEASICISANYINAIGNSICGTSITNLYAGYNGGTNPSGSCGQSVNCSGQTDCSGDPVRRWECLYDDNAHTVCNGGSNILSGYNQTRQGAVRALYCSTNPGF